MQAQGVLFGQAGVVFGIVIAGIWMRQVVDGCRFGLSATVRLALV